VCHLLVGVKNNYFICSQLDLFFEKNNNLSFFTCKVVYVITKMFMGSISLPNTNEMQMVMVEFRSLRGLPFIQVNI
jgi:hypothetical protein